MGGSSSDSGDQRHEIRYAPYIEEHHSEFLDLTATKRDAIIDSSPFSGHSDVLIDVAFFGTGYTISSFPSLYDMYGKFMAGLDVEVLWNQAYDDTLDGTVTGNLVSAEAALLDDDVDSNVLPRFKAGLRDINSVMTSSFVVGSSLIEDARVKSLAKFSAELKYRLLPLVTERWARHLDWNGSVIRTYMEVMKLFYSAKMDIENHNYEYDAKDALWPFTVLDYERANLGALQGATNTKSDVAGASTAQKAIGGALSGAAAGAMVSGGNPIGAAVGGVLGLAASFM